MFNEVGKMRRILMPVLAVMMFLITSCGRFDDIKVNSANIENIQPYGLKGLDMTLKIEVDNPAAQVSLSEMEAVVKNSGKVIGRVTVDPFTMKARRVEMYDLKARMTLDQSVSLFDILMLFDKGTLETCVVDVTLKARLKSGVSRTLNEKDIPLKKLIDYADKTRK